jgi:hypothetical protein
MKWLATWAFIIYVTGCTTMRPIDGSPRELQQFINSGELLKVGDRVRIVTADEEAHRFAITKMEAGPIVGRNESVPVDQVMSLEIENAKPAASTPLDTKAVTDWLIVLSAFALKPTTVDATPSP